MKLKEKLLLAGLIVLLGIGPLMNTYAAGERSYSQMLDDWQLCSAVAEIELDVKTAERDYQAALDSADRAGSAYSSSAARFSRMDMEIPEMLKFNVVLQRDIGRVQAEQNLDAARSGAEVRMLQSEIELRKLYLAFIQADGNLEARRISLEIAGINMDRADISYENGNISAADYAGQQLSYLEAQADYDQAERSLTLARLALNGYLDVPMDTAYRTDFSEYEAEVGIFNIEVYIAGMTEENLVLRQYQNRLEIYGLQEEAYLKFGMDQEREESYADLLEDRFEQEILYTDALLETERGVREAVLDLRYDQQVIRQKLTARNEQLHNLEEMQALYEAGTVSKTQLLTAELGYIQASNAYQNYVYQYNTAVMEFNAAVSTGLTVPAIGTAGGSTANSGGRQ